MRSANKVSGYLIRVGDDIMFRVYECNSAEKFTDYNIYHYDMCVTINDSDAYFYKNDTDHFIDYSPQTLGRTHESHTI